jgi:hypothetical protein
MISQRKLPACGAGGWVSGLPESDPGGEVEKFMSVILTYLGFNVTKQWFAAKH